MLAEISGSDSHHHVSRVRPEYFDTLRDARTRSTATRVVPAAPVVGTAGPESDTKEPYHYRRCDGGLDVAAIGRDFADGYTIVLDSIHRYVRAIASLLHAIEVELNFATQVNAYFTPPESQGFVPHYDEHDVLIVQLRGSKIWHLYDGIDVAPRAVVRHEPVAADALPSPTDVRLEVGDVLYLPGGRVHAAEATSEVSVHLTVGVLAPTLLVLVTRALNSLSGSDDHVHTQLPPRYLDDPDVRATLGVPSRRR